MRKMIKIPLDLDVPGELEIYTHLAGLRNRGRIDILCAALGMHPDPVAHNMPMPAPTPTPTPAPVATPVVAPVATPVVAPVVAPVVTSALMPVQEHMTVTPTTAPPATAPETESIDDTPVTTPNPNIDLGLSQMY